MNFRLKKNEELSGKRATIYTVETENGADLFEQFLLEYRGDNYDDIKNIVMRIRSISQKTGAQENFFKIREGRPGDGVAALFDTPYRHLRLYCIRMGNSVVILGGGGIKKTRTLQEDPKLREENELLREVAAKVTEKMKQGDIYFTFDEMELAGDLNFYE